MKSVRARISVGYRVGSITVEERTSETKSGYSIWRCRCDCGNEIFLDTRCLQRGTVTDCGCKTKIKPGTTDITGKKFGKLTAIEQTDERKESGSVVWICKCDCGNMCKASLHQLQAGYRKSCGCLSSPVIKDYVGKKFGQLTVIEYAGKEKGMHQWRCRCSCGKEAVVGQTRLQSGKTRSCGCLQEKSYLNNIGIVDGTSVSVLEYYKKHLSPNNTSGYNGVFQNSRNSKWIATMEFQGKKYYFGSYENIEAAINARKNGEKIVDDFLQSFYDNNPSW